MIPLLPFRRDVTIAVLISAGLHFSLAFYSRERPETVRLASSFDDGALPPAIEVVPVQPANADPEIPRDTNPIARGVEPIETDTSNPFKMAPEPFVPSVPGFHYTIPARMGPVGPIGAPPPFEMSSLDRVPVAKFRAAPQYPFEERRRGVSGDALIDFIVDAEGKVYGAHAVSGTSANFSEAAVRALMKWKFTPGMKGGRSVATHMQLPIRFTINEET